MHRIHVVAAVIRNRRGEILIAQRPRDKHQGGLWEFPGGKVEAGEAVTAALVRELEEELGITPTDFRPLIRIAHDYPDKQVLLDVWQVEGFRGEAHGREQQPLRWVTAAELPRYAFPAANLPIITAARLPDRLLITPDPAGQADLSGWLLPRLQGGIRLVLLRAPGLDHTAYARLATEALELCRRAGADLLLHGHADLLSTLGAAGCHLDSASLKLASRRPVPPGKWFSASCHDAAELAQAARLGTDFVTLSPVRETASHPGATTLGWEGFARLVAGVAMPVYALGGLAATDLKAAWEAGAQGVAGITRL